MYLTKILWINRVNFLILKTEFWIEVFNMKKLWIISFVLVIAGALAIGYFLLRGKFEPKEDVYHAVPMDASFLIEVKDFNDFIYQLQENSLIWNELVRLKKVQNASKALSKVDSILKIDQSIGTLIDQKSVLVSVHNIGKEDPRLLFLCQLKENAGFSSFENVVKKSFSGSWDIRERIYHKTKLFEMTERSSKFSISFSSYKGVVAVSTSSILVESAMRQLDVDKSILDQKGFSEVKHTAGAKVDGNLYINFAQFPRFLSVLTNPEFINKIYSIKSFSSWAELDINLKEDALLLNGFTYTDDSLNFYSNIFEDQFPQKSSIDQILPANIISYAILGLSNFDKFFKDYKDYLKGINQFKSFEDNLKKAGAKWGTDLPGLFLPLLDNEMGIAYPAVKKNSTTQNSYVIFGLRSMTRASEQLAGSIVKFCKKNNLETDKYILSIDLDTETRFPVFKLPVKTLPGLLFGDIFEGSPHQFVIFLDGYMIFGNSVRSLSSFIYDNLLQKTLSHELDYRKFKESLSDRSNFYFYLNIPRSTGLYGQYLNAEYFKGLKSNIKVFQKLQAIGFQFSNENRMIYNNIYLKYQPEFKEVLETRWESLLDTTLRSKPIFVKNHINGDKEIFIQDEKSNIYLINSSGRVIWKINLPEKILSEVYQIDFYKNKKLQYLFNTKSNIYLMDRNGNNVENYPIKLRSEASNGLAIFDYDKNLDYRICIAGKDKKIYLYTKKGKLVKGWSSPRLESFVSTPVYHFRVKKKDYILVSDKSKLYILNRRGKNRINVSTSIQKPIHQELFLDKSTSASKFVTTGDNGMVYFIGLDGKVTKTNMGKFSPEHYFEYRDLDGDGKKEFIFLDQHELKVFNSSGKQRFSYKFSGKISNKPSIYRFASNNLKIGVVSSHGHKIYLFNKDGSLYKDFPLSGQTAFSIGRFKNSTSRFNLIVGGDDNFLYNYAVQ